MQWGQTRGTKHAIELLVLPSDHSPGAGNEVSYTMRTHGLILNVKLLEGQE